MPNKLDYDVSRKRFEEAFNLARSDDPLPQEWLDRARKVGESPNKTFIALLGTALLAKSTDARVDPFALKTRKYRTAYSARSLCKDVLVPCAVAAGVHIGTTGREPLNNQPFFRYDRVARDMDVHASTRPHLDYLCESLGALKQLDHPETLKALAAFLRIRLAEALPQIKPVRVQLALGVSELISQASLFITEDPESGKRGQALVAAALDLVFDDVRTTRVYDPSRHWPGDVVVGKENAITLSVEVKQRPASATEILQFAARCAEMKVHRAIAATLHPEQAPLDADELREESWRRMGVHLSVLEGASATLLSALTWTHRPLEDALQAFPQLMADRLEELEVSREGQARWKALFEERR